MSTGEELSVVGMEENGREQEREQEQEQEHSSKSDVAAAIQACDPPSKSLTQEQEQEQQRQQLQQYKVDVVEPLRTLVSRPHGEELSEDSIGEIRELLARRLPACVQDDCIGPLRAKLWSIMLLGLRPQDLNSQHNLVSSSLHGRTSEADHAQGLMHFPQEDQRVLAADIKRTRQGYPMFKRDDVMHLVSQVLERYCVGHGIRYKQGQNELIAPFVMLQDPPLPLPVLGLLFESFMSRFVSRWYVDDEIEALIVSYRVFRVLLFYVDPGLAGKLDDCELIPELYATAWLITLFSRNLSLEMVARLWDVYMAVNDPSLVFFLLASLLVRNRDALMEVEHAHMMPEAVQGLTVRDGQDLEELIVQAREMLKKIPGTFLRTVRSCCSDHGNTPLDTSRSLFCESVRCASIGPGELLERMDARSSAAMGIPDTEADKQGRAAGSKSPCPMRPGPLATVALDIRPSEEYVNSGVGHLGKSVRLDPSLLLMEDVLEKWMQHFDGTRGTHVCLVDSIWPAACVEPYSPRGQSYLGNKGKNRQAARQRSNAATSSAGRGIVTDPLWRRLLLGEGEDDWLTLSDQWEGADCGGGMSTPSAHVNDDGRGHRRGVSGSGGGSAADGRGFGAAKMLAEKLHARGFPYVSILEGGMEGVIKHLKDEGIPLEPTVINHDAEAYEDWREGHESRLPKGGKMGAGGTPLAHKRIPGERFDCRGYGNVRHLDVDSPTRVSMRTDRAPSSSASNVGRGRSQSAGSTWAGAELAARGQGGLRLGVMETLSKIRQGVNKGVEGVGTVARTSAWAMEKGAEGVGNAAMSSARAVMDVVMEDINAQPTYDARDNSAGGTGNDPDDDDGEMITFTGFLSLDQGAQAVGQVARTGAQAVKETAQILNPFPAVERNAVEGGALSHQPPGGVPGRGGGEEGGGPDASGGMEGEGVMVMEPQRRLGNDVSDREIMLLALETAEAKGHEKVAKSLRSRLGLPSGRPDSARQGGDHTGAASLSTQQQRQEKEKDEEEDKEIWASIADLA